MERRAPPSPDWSEENPGGRWILSAHAAGAQRAHLDRLGIAERLLLCATSPPGRTIVFVAQFRIEMIARPDQNFFRTLSSFNLHTDYHRPQDEAGLADGDHMTAVIEAAARAVHLLSTGPRPEWKPGGRP